MKEKFRPNAIVIAFLVALLTFGIAILLSLHDKVDSQLFTVLITAGVVGLVTLAVKIVEGPSVPADTHERIVKGESTPLE